MAKAIYYIKKETRRIWRYGHWENEVAYVIYKGNTSHGSWTTRKQAEKALAKLRRVK